METDSVEIIEYQLTESWGWCETKPDYLKALQLQVIGWAQKDYGCEVVIIETKIRPGLERDKDGREEDIVVFIFRAVKKSELPRINLDVAITGTYVGEL